MSEKDKKMISVDEEEYKGLLSKNIAQGTKIDQLTAQLHDATEALVVIKDKMEAAEKEEKDAVISELVRDSNGKLTVENLKDHNLNELYFLKDTLDKAEPKTFVSVMKQREIDAQKPPIQGTMGGFNQETGKYEGGIEA